MHFDETRAAYLAEFDRLAAEIREDLADPKFRLIRWDKAGFPFRDIGQLAEVVHSLNRVQEAAEKAASAKSDPITFLPDVPAHRFPEDRYQDTWRKAHPGIRTDWILIGDEDRESWRTKIDEASKSPLV